MEETQDIAAAVPPPEGEPKVDSAVEDMKTEEPAAPASAPSENNKPADIAESIPLVEPKIEDNNATKEDAATAAINSDIEMESAAAPPAVTADINSDIKMVDNTTEEFATAPSEPPEPTVGDNTTVASAAAEVEKESIDNPGVPVAEDVPTSPSASDEPVKAPVHPEPPQASPIVKADYPSVDGNTINNKSLPDGASATTVLSPGRIPKKVLAPPAAIDSSGSTLTLVNRLAGSNSFDNALVLPDGVVLPPTVTPQMLEGRLRRAFFELNPAQMKECLSEYNDAVKEKGAEIRNHAAYLFGVVKRYKTIHERSFSDPNALPQGKELTDQVKIRLGALVASGFCTADEVDGKINERMKMLSEKDALDAIDEMNSCNRQEIRNFGSYFMGIMNRYMRGERNNPMSRGSNRRNNGNRNHSSRDSSSHYGRGNNNSGSSHYGRSDSRGGRDRDRYRDDSRSSYRSSRRRRSRSRSYSSSRSRSRSPDYDYRRRRRRSRSDSRDNYHRRSDRSKRSHNINPSASDPRHRQSQPVVSQMSVPPPSQPPRPPNMQMGQFPGQPQMIAQNPQQLAMQQYLQQQQAQAAQQKAAQQQAIVQQALNQALPQQPPQMHPGMQSQQPNNVAVTHMLLGQPGNNQPNAQMYMQNQNQSQSTPLDILALANKASQALSGLPQTMNPNFPPPARPPTQTFAHQKGNEKELPLMVQYAIQNLRTTGHIEQTLDAPLVAMLKRLPEHSALQALEIFSTCDLAKMRNKGAYLSGILKKELIKNGL